MAGRDSAASLQGDGMRRKDCPNPERLRRFIQDELKPLRELASLYEVSHPTVLKWARAHGIQVPNKREGRVIAPKTYGWKPEPDSMAAGFTGSGNANR